MQELATDSHYKLSDTKYPVTFAYAGQDTAVVKIAANDGKAIENDLIYSRNGFKVVSGGKPQTETHGLCAIYAEYSFRLRRRNNRIFHDIY